MFPNGSLEWRDVNLDRREMTIQAAKAKTRASRIVLAGLIINWLLRNCSIDDLAG